MKLRHRINLFSKSWLSLIICLLLSPKVLGQKKMDLDDLAIKGQLHNDDRLRMLARQKYQLKNYIKYRQNFREEIVENIPKSRPLSYVNNK